MSALSPEQLAVIERAWRRAPLRPDADPLVPTLQAIAVEAHCDALDRRDLLVWSRAQDRAWTSSTTGPRDLIDHPAFRTHA